MAEKLKYIFFTEKFIQHLADTVKKYYKPFDQKKFIQLVTGRDWKEKELKEKMRHISESLHETLPGNYKKALKILYKCAPATTGFEALVFADYVEVYGLKDREASLSALEYFTRFGSAEFAIRHFIAENPKKVLALMSRWAEDENEHVRRLASEGSRPRLPWAMGIPELKKDPSPILPILEKLKKDPSETVRRSVANNLNDISKDHPAVTLDVCEKWQGTSPETERLIKHACRGLLKAGNKRALRLFGYSGARVSFVEKLKLSKKNIPAGEALDFEFQLKITGKEELKIRLEYRMDFAKAKGKRSLKVFKIAERDFTPGKYTFAKKHSFADMTTRKHYPGKHGLTILVNGEEKSHKDFEVT